MRAQHEAAFRPANMITDLARIVSSTVAVPAGALLLMLPRMGSLLYGKLRTAAVLAASWAICSSSSPAGRGGFGGLGLIAACTSK